MEKRPAPAGGTAPGGSWSEKEPSAESGVYTGTARKVRVVRYIAMAGLAAFLVISLFTLRGDMNLDNLRALWRYFDYGADAAGAVVVYDVGEDARFAAVGSNVIVYSERRLMVFDGSGRILQDERVSLANPRAAAGGDRFALWGDGQKEYRFYSPFSKLREEQGDYPVNSIAMGPDGACAVLTREAGYRSAVLVYNSGGELLFRWLSSDRLVTAMTFSEEGGLVIVSVSSDADGALESKIVCFDLKSEEPYLERTVSGELIAAALPFSDFLLVGDSAVYIAGDNFRRISYEGLPLKKISCSGGRFTAVYGYGLLGAGNIVKTYDAEGTALYAKTLNGTITDLISAGDRVYILTPGAVLRIGPDGEETKISVAGSYSRILMLENGSLALCSDEKTTILKLE